MNRTRAAWILAATADALQILLLPATGMGALSLVNDVIDVVVAILMIALMGWNIAFLPTAIAEVVPVLNLFPTWTAAMFFVSRRRVPDENARRKDLPPGAR